ncbi:hypothetical protein Hanom_Chr01g00006551 [Helianthus anomalus]
MNQVFPKWSVSFIVIHVKFLIFEIKMVMFGCIIWFLGDNISRASKCFCFTPCVGSKVLIFRGWERVTVKKVQNSLVILKCIKKISFGLMIKMVALIKAILRPKRTSFGHFRLVPILIQRRNISHIVTSSTKNVFCFQWLIFKDQSL